MDWSPTHVDDPDCIDILSLHSHRETEKKKNEVRKAEREALQNHKKFQKKWRRNCRSLKNATSKKYSQRKKRMYIGKYILYFLVETPGLGSIVFGWT